MGELETEWQHCDTVERHRVRCDSSSTMLTEGEKKKDQPIRSKNLVIKTNHREKRRFQLCFEAETCPKTKREFWSLATSDSQNIMNDESGGGLACWQLMTSYLNSVMIFSTTQEQTVRVIVQLCMPIYTIYQHYWIVIDTHMFNLRL